MKKKPAPPKKTEKRTAVPHTIEHKTQRARGTARPAGPASSKTGVAAQSGKAPLQMDVFSAAMRLFHARRFADAREQFRKALDGANREIAHRAGLHIRMCEQRLENSHVVLKTSEDHYNYAVTLINSRDLAEAERHLQAALHLDGNADHVYYAMALCRGLSGDFDGAYENLKRAIELQPRNRILARQDVDFAPFSHQPPLDRLLHPDKARY